MSNINIFSRRSRGRPKKNVNYATLAGFSNLNRPANVSRPVNISRPINVSQSTNVNRPPNIHQPANVNRSANMQQPANVNRPANITQHQPANLVRPISIHQPANAHHTPHMNRPANLHQPANVSRPINIHRSPIAHLPANLSIKRKQGDEEVDEILILSSNGIENPQVKKSKLGDDHPKRSLPHRAARFTESYGGSPDVVIVSDEENDEESESESDSDCSPIPSPVCPVKTKEELELWESNVQKLKKQLNDEEMKLVLLLKLKDSQKVKEQKTEASGSPLPSATLSSQLPNINSHKNHPAISRNHVQEQSFQNKQLMPSKFLPVKKVCVNILYIYFFKLNSYLLLEYHEKLNTCFLLELLLQPSLPITIINN